MSRVEHQLWKNGGDSLADEVGETHRIASETATEVRLMKDILADLNWAGARICPSKKKKTTNCN
jgi:hypothetical protein